MIGYKKLFSAHAKSRGMWYGGRRYIVVKSTPPDKVTTRVIVFTW